MEISDQALSDLISGVKLRNIMGSVSRFSVVDAFAERVCTAAAENRDRIVIEELRPETEKPQPRRRKRAS